MSKPKPKIEKFCPVCGATFFTARKEQRTCGRRDCREEHHRRQLRAEYALNGKARRAASAKANVSRTYLPSADFQKMLADIWAPPPDDVPIRNFI